MDNGSEYLGDSVYAEMNEPNGQVSLYTSNGFGRNAVDTIYIEEDTAIMLIGFLCKSFPSAAKELGQLIADAAAEHHKALAEAGHVASP